MTTTSRRMFLVNGARAGITVCGVCACCGLPAWAGGDGEEAETLIDPKNLEFCGYSCPEDTQPMAIKHLTDEQVPFCSFGEESKKTSLWKRL